MKNKLNKEGWINEVLDSTGGMARATPPAHLYHKITTGLRLEAPKSRTIAIHTKQWAAAAILLLALNVGSILYFTAHNSTGHTGDASPLTEIQQVSTYNY